ncbi:MAG: NADH-quinone oxidoreductase subunit J [Sphingomonadaceae bacterium]
MTAVFYLSGAVAVIATALAVTRVFAVHALLYLIVSLLSVALVFYSLGAAFVAALEVIVYAGAIMVLFLFVIMMLNLSPEGIAEERLWWTPRMWVGPSILATLLVAELVYVLASGGNQPQAGSVVDPRQVGMALFGPYLLGVEVASFLLLAGLVGAYHLGHRQPAEEERFGGA